VHNKQIPCLQCGNVSIMQGLAPWMQQGRRRRTAACMYYKTTPAAAFGVGPSGAVRCGAVCREAGREVGDE
jgi:hypothetical protein